MLTNDEKRAGIYNAVTQRCTDPGTVTPDTPLASLNLNWRERDLPERERTKHVHRLHPYLGKFIPQLVEIFLRKFFTPGQTVLDPFCGSGTTLIQANELGINSVGFDISAFNVLLCEAKTQKYEVRKLRAEVLDILEKVRFATQTKTNQLSLWAENTQPPLTDKTDSEYLSMWFAPQALKELLYYRKLIDTEKYKYKKLLKVILSRSARSVRLTTHFDLDFPKKPQTQPYWCYKHSRTCQPTHHAFKFLERYSIDTLERIQEFDSLRTDAKIAVHHRDSRTATIPPVNGVVTSPPYVGLIDYHDQHAYAYHLLGLRDRRHKEIGPASNGSSQKAKKQYLDDIATVFHHAAKAMPSRGVMVVVAHDSHKLYTQLPEMIGVTEEAVVQRHVNRRTGRRASDFFESVFIWRKP